MNHITETALNSALTGATAHACATARESDSFSPCNNMGVTDKSIGQLNTPLEESFLMMKHKKGVIVKVPKPDTNSDIKLSLVDWVSFTFHISRFSKTAYSQALQVDLLSQELNKIFGFGVTEKRKAGLNFYTDSYELGSNGFGQLCIGGQNGTCLITIKGQGLLHSLKGWEHKLTIFLEQIEATITRVDLACDLFDSPYSLNDFLQTYQDGLFTHQSIAPAVEQMGDWVNEKNNGRSLYIGKKSTGKRLRIYEKGKQLGGKFTSLFSAWVRVELELSNKGRTLPYAVLTQCGQYLAGAYPALSFIYEKQSTVKTSRKTTELDLKRSLEIVRHQFGAYIFAFNELYGSEKTIEMLTKGKEKIPARLNAVNDINNLKNKLQG